MNPHPPEAADKWRMVCALSASIERILRKRKRTQEEAQNLQRLQAQRSALQATFRPLPVAPTEPPMTHPGIKVGSLVGI